MTQPPDEAPQPPAAGEYPAAAPPSPPRRRLGCWGLGAITCGSLFLIFAVFLVTVLGLLRPYLADIWESGQLSARCAQNLQAIYGALDRYRAARGVHPARLTDLRPVYLSRAQIFRCPADGSPSGPTSYEYTPPAPARRAAATAAAPLLTCNHHSLEIAGHKAVNRLELMPDGTIRQETFILSETPDTDRKPQMPQTGEGGG
jgi:hypothetical protein